MRFSRSETDKVSSTYPNNLIILNFHYPEGTLGKHICLLVKALALWLAPNFRKGFQMFDNKNVGTLNSLIATTLDSVDGYRKAANETNAARFKDIFLSRANERQAIVGNLQAKVRELGGNPEDDGTVLASAHRAFLGLRDALTGDQDDSAVVAEVERGEDHIKAKFESALKDDELDPTVRHLIQTCFSSVREGHDQMSALKHELDA